MSSNTEFLRRFRLSVDQLIEELQPEPETIRECARIMGPLATKQKYRGIGSKPCVSCGEPFQLSHLYHAFKDNVDEAMERVRKAIALNDIRVRWEGKNARWPCLNGVKPNVLSDFCCDKCWSRFESLFEELAKPREEKKARERIAKESRDQRLREQWVKEAADRDKRIGRKPVRSALQRIPQSPVLAFRLLPGKKESAIRVSSLFVKRIPQHTPQDI